MRSESAVRSKSLIPKSRLISFPFGGHSSPPRDPAAKLRAGIVWANTFNKLDPTSPFGGYKESGFGREGGIHGLVPYVKLS